MKKYVVVFSFAFICVSFNVNFGRVNQTGAVVRARDGYVIGKKQKKGAEDK